MSQMKKEINAFGNELQSVTGLAQTGIVEIDTEKMLWYSPKLRTLQISIETEYSNPRPAGSANIS